MCCSAREIKREERKRESVAKRSQADSSGNVCATSVSALMVITSFSGAGQSTLSLHFSPWPLTCCWSCCPVRLRLSPTSSGSSCYHIHSALLLPLTYHSQILLTSCSCSSAAASIIIIATLALAKPCPLTQARRVKASWSSKCVANNNTSCAAQKLNRKLNPMVKCG